MHFIRTRRTLQKSSDEILHPKNVKIFVKNVNTLLFESYSHLLKYKKEDNNLKYKLYAALLILVFLSSGIAYAKGNSKEVKLMSKIVQTAGRNQLGNFAPDFAHYNDDILFGENWNNTDIDLKTRSLITVVSLMSQGLTDNSLKYHLQNAKNHGVTKSEIAAAITHCAFYSGWPKAWATFNLAKEVWTEDIDTSSLNEKDKYAQTIMFPIGEENRAYAKYFIGKSYLAPISTSQVKMYNVTFEPKCRNNWHVHNAKTGGGQILIAIGGRGYYQERGKEPQILNVGDVVNISAGVKHWHGAAPDSWFSHIAVEAEGIETSNEWLEPVSDEEYGKLK